MTEPVVPQPSVEVLWRPACGYCLRLRRDLTRRGIDSTWRNIWEDADARALVARLNNGNEVVPTVRVGEKWLANPSGSRVAALAVRAGSSASPDATRTHSRLVSLSSWLPVALLVAASELGASGGRSVLSLGLDGAAVGAWWATRLLRR